MGLCPGNHPFVVNRPCTTTPCSTRSPSGPASCGSCGRLSAPPPSPPSSARPPPSSLSLHAASRCPPRSATRLRRRWPSSPRCSATYWSPSTTPSSTTASTVAGGWWGWRAGNSSPTGCPSRCPNWYPCRCLCVTLLLVSVSGILFLYFICFKLRLQLVKMAAPAQALALQSNKVAIKKSFEKCHYLIY